MQSIIKGREAGASRNQETLDFTRMLEAMPLAAYSTDRDGRITSCNRHAMKAWGREPQLGRDRYCGSLRLYTPDGVLVPHEQCVMAKCLRDRRQYDGEEIVIERADGSRLLVLANATPYFDAAGELIGALNVLVDPARGRRVRPGLDRRERELADFFENAAIGLHWVGPDGIILEANRAELRLLGYSREEYVGHHIGEFHADQHVIEDILQRLRAGEELHDCEARLVCKDGSIKHVVIDSNVYWEDGQFVHTRCFTRDATRRKRAEEELQEREVWLCGQGEALQAALDGAPLESSLGILVRTATQLFGSGVRAAFYLANAEGTALHHVVGMEPGYAQAVDGFKIGPESLSCGLASYTGESIFTSDVTREPLWGAWLWLAEKFDFRGCWSIPIHTSKRKFAGTCAIYWREPRAATARDTRFTALIAQAAGMIISRHSEMEQRRRVEEELRRSEERLQLELEDTKLLQSVSAELLREQNFEALYERLLEAVMAVMRSDFAIMQMLVTQHDPAGELQLLDARGFPPQAAQLWKQVRADSNSVCGIALRYGSRVIDPDIANSQIMAGTQDRAALLENGVRAAQSTPLISRSGRVLGMISTHWRHPHQPDERDLRLLDLLARQAADLLERKQAEEAERKQAGRLRVLWQAAATLLTADDPEAMLRGLLDKIGPHLGVEVYLNYLMNERRDGLRLASYAGLPLEAAEKIAHLELGQAICGTVAERRQSIVADHIQQSSDPKAQLVKSLGIRAYACNPLLVDNVLLGTLSFASRVKDQFHPDELAVMETISHYVTVAYERLRLLSELKEAGDRKDQFLATLAHELRNPLAPIRNSLHVLRLGGAGGDTVERVQEMMERQVRHMVRLVDDLMEVSRITRGKIELRKEPTDLATILQSAVETSRPLIDAARHELSMSLPPDRLMLHADPVRLTQIVANLLNNAAKYTEEGGRIWLTARKEGAYAVVSIRDNGMGMPPEVLPKVFDLFTQGSRTYGRAQGGLGIGLTLVRSLVEMHGGSVEAKSGGPGMGSEFVVRLPLACASFERRDQVEQDAQAEAVWRRRRILVVDDHRDAAESLAMLLQLLGAEVRIANDGPAALEALRIYQPSIVLLDIGMPGMDGFEVARCVRSCPEGRDVTLIALTGWGQEEDRRRSRDAGFDHHLVKPVDFGALETLLAQDSLPGVAPR